MFRLGRQWADHSRLEREMLRVRVPPEPSITPSWSSPECSPRCQRGGRGFESRRGLVGEGRYGRHGTQTGKAARLKPGDSVGSTPTRATHRTARRVAELVDARASEARAPEAWECDSPPGDGILSRRAGARPGLISPACPARYRGLGLAGGPVPGRASYARRRRFDSPTRNCRYSRHGTLTGIAATTTLRAVPGAWCLWVRIPPCY